VAKVEVLNGKAADVGLEMEDVLVKAFARTM